MKRAKIFNYIEGELSTLATRIELRGKQNIHDLNIFSEDFYQHFFNELFGWKLQNLNISEKNAPGIDLVDHHNKIVVQVSATATKKKVESALSKDLSPYAGYAFKFISISKNAAALRNKVFANPHKLTFDPHSDIYDISSILSHVRGQNLDYQERIFDFIRKEYDNHNLKLPGGSIIKIQEQDNWSQNDRAEQCRPFDASWGGNRLGWITCKAWLKLIPLWELYVEVKGKALLPEEPLEPTVNFQYPRNDTIYTIQQYDPLNNRIVFQYCKFKDIVLRGLEHKATILPETENLKWFMSVGDRTTPGGFVCVTVFENALDSTFDMIKGIRKNDGMANNQERWSTIPRFFHRPFNDECPETDSKPIKCIAAEFAKELFNLTNISNSYVSRWAELISKNACITGAGISATTGHYEIAILLVLTDNMRISWNRMNGKRDEEPWDFNGTLEHQNDKMKSVPLSPDNKERFVEELSSSQTKWASGCVPAIIQSVRTLKYIVSKNFPGYTIMEIMEFDPPQKTESL